MFDITVEVSGPGGCISATIEVIKRALANANVKTLVVVDQHPSIVLEHNLNLKDENITIKANHCPWGG